MNILSASGHYCATASAAVLQVSRSPSESMKVKVENTKCSEEWFKVMQMSMTAIKKAIHFCQIVRKVIGYYIATLALKNEQYNFI